MAGSPDPIEMRMILLCHVDDIMIAPSSSDKTILSALLNGSFKTNIPGKLTHYGGCSFVRDLKKGICFFRTSYASRGWLGGLESRRDEKSSLVCPPILIQGSNGGRVSRAIPETPERTFVDRKHDKTRDHGR